MLPDTIDWTQVSQTNIPYRLHQFHGRHNALGLIKFDFQNTDAVYLHDTNNKSAFKRRVRAISHGCIRVENPFELAQIIYDLNGFDSLQVEQYSILVGNPPTTEEEQKFLEKLQQRDSIREANLSDEERIFYRRLQPTSINLKQKIPLFIEYRTCFVGPNQEIQYREDIYYKDDNILFVLREAI